MKLALPQSRKEYTHQRLEGTEEWLGEALCSPTPKEQEQLQLGMPTSEHGSSVTKTHSCFHCEIHVVSKTPET
jgi:hypothetical protein